ncbi:hypothetical protein LJC47_04455 [Desulfosarcina sp. OttesenSCG-928-B08]|nr:hypothetical protein [Desulfosarcina sp. OttesenSCG-928-B08]
MVARYSPRFLQIFVAISDLLYRDFLIQHLQAGLCAPDADHCLLDLSKQKEWPDFSHLEDHLIHLGPSIRFVHLVNGEYWLQGKNLEAFNLRRDAIANHLRCVLIWWLPEAAIKRIATMAPDVWSWRGGVFDLTLPIQLMPPERLQPQKVWQIHSKEDRYQRLFEIDQMLENTMPDTIRFTLFIEKAELLQELGLWDETLCLLTEEVLPLCERLDDVQSKAATQGKIADIRYRRGELDEALRIRIEEELPVYERLGDVRSKAVTQGKIADILYRRGELDEALRIRIEEELPVYERLGDVRSKAVTQGQIADIRYRRGELDEALRIRIEEELPVYERLGDVREKAVCKANIAAILYAQGEFENALGLLREEVLPIFERLGCVYEKAAVQENIAHILKAQEKK